MVYFKPYFRDFRLILNGRLMTGWITGQGLAIEALTTAANVKKTGFNAFSNTVKIEHNAGPFGDRVVANVINRNPTYGLQRELGGHANPNPERALFHAMKGVSGGRAVASPKIVRGGTARRSKPKPFLNANKYSGGAR